MFLAGQIIFRFPLRKLPFWSGVHLTCLRKGVLFPLVSKEEAVGGQSFSESLLQTPVPPRAMGGRPHRTYTVVTSTPTRYRPRPSELVDPEQRFVRQFASLEGVGKGRALISDSIGAEDD